MHRVPVGRSAYSHAISRVFSLSKTQTKTRPRLESTMRPKRSCGLRMRSAAERMGKPMPLSAAIISVATTTRRATPIPSLIYWPAGTDEIPMVRPAGESRNHEQKPPCPTLNGHDGSSPRFVPPAGAQSRRGKTLAKTTGSAYY